MEEQALEELLTEIEERVAEMQIRVRQPQPQLHRDAQTLNRLAVRLEAEVREGREASLGEGC